MMQISVNNAAYGRGANVLKDAVAINKMTLEQHELDVQELGKLEHHLIEIVGAINNEILREKFLEWQKQRNKCNEGFNKLLVALENA
jgi:hypothetical protein